MTLAERMLEDSRLMSETGYGESEKQSGIKASDLIASVRQAYDERWGYIWGKSGQVWTQAAQDKATRDMTRRYGQQWVGRKVADCSGLLVWAFKKLGGSIYHGSNTMWNKYCTNQGSLTGVVKIRPGTAVFMLKDGNRHHVGLYIGDGMCIEAQGTRTGVVQSHLSRWDEWGELVGVDYSGVGYDLVEIGLRTLRKGDSGADVRTAQELLVSAGYDVGKVDGIYGGNTLSAVRAFQHDNGLTPDGIVGPLTWDKLKATEDDGEIKPEDAPIAPQEPSGEDPENPSLTYEERITRLERAVFGQEGGTPDG